MAEKTIKVGGMDCGGCELSIQEEFDKLDGVRGANADHEAGTVQVVYEENRVTDEQFKGAIEEAGYSVSA